MAVDVKRAKKMIPPKLWTEARSWATRDGKTMAEYVTDALLAKVGADRIKYLAENKR